MTLLTGDPRHGTRNGYVNHHCRCGPCHDAQMSHHIAYLEAVTVCWGTGRSNRDRIRLTQTDAWDWWPGDSDPFTDEPTPVELPRRMVQWA